MEIIPAIDLREGRCVRLVHGEMEAETVYSADPPAMARHWESLGARRLHVIDLDGAFSGSPKHLPIVREITRAVAIPIQFGGGLRSLETIRECFHAGVDRVILGTAALSSPDLVMGAIEEYPGRIYIALDARGGNVAVKGWKETTSVGVIPMAEKLGVWGVAGLIYTDISRDGTLSGPNLEGLEALTRETRLPVIASGGVGTLEHIRSLLSLSLQGVQGVIVGKALYDGAVDLKKALELVAGE
ncbi:MAG TPA: 1-(5-phosphoribosyl)-5-[(5-phosphoribosylamino)methylideneamino]imidazole-4-carboxamide isomerase [bacterium]|nr:1-(5-phosphoribosyl)-5-[(5-phosphoribosylamino)methylideneamino]imidazole-4-carboxamide isomerase [bacterium]